MSTKNQQKEVAKEILSNKDEKNFSFNELLNKVTNHLPTCKGNKKESIYKNSIFADCQDKDEKKQRRKKIRNLAENFCKAILQSPNNEQLKKDFLEFYKQCYLINDFSVNSICSKNTDSLQIDNYKKMFEILKK